jgi:hypothetical protein
VQKHKSKKDYDYEPEYKDGYEYYHTDGELLLVHQSRAMCALLCTVVCQRHKQPASHCIDVDLLADKHLLNR